MARWATSARDEPGHGRIRAWPLLNAKKLRLKGFRRIVPSVQGSPREHPRFAHKATVRIFIDGRVVTGVSANLSKGGLCGSFDSAVPSGVDVELDLSLIFEAQGESEPLRLAARVAWCTSLDGDYQIGVAFKSLDVARARYLAVFMKFLDAKPVNATPGDDDVFASATQKRF
jgi:hypothetical protein